MTSSIGIDSSAYPFGYLATWSGSGAKARKAISESAQRIHKAAHVILDDSEANGVAVVA